VGGRGGANVPFLQSVASLVITVYTDGVYRRVHRVDSARSKDVFQSQEGTFGLFRSHCKTRYKYLKDINRLELGLIRVS